eukprot:UN10502
MKMIFCAFNRVDATFHPDTYIENLDSKVRPPVSNAIDLVIAFFLS